MSTSRVSGLVPGLTVLPGAERTAALNHLAAAGSDNLVRLWDVARQEELGLLTGHTGSIAALECHDKVLISAGYDTTVRIWSIADRVAGAEAIPPKVGRTIESLPRAR